MPLHVNLQHLPFQDITVGCVVCIRSGGIWLNKLQNNVKLPLKSFMFLFP